MNRYVVLLRGINVGGKNMVPMAGLRQCMERLGFDSVETYIASGNVVFRSAKSPLEIKALIERALPISFKLDSSLIKVLVLTRDQLKAIIDNRPQGFADQPGKYHSDAIFLMDMNARDAMAVFKPKEGVDQIWPGLGVIYSQRLTALRTRSGLSKIMGTPAYQSMTIRTWNTAVALLKLLDQLAR